MSASGSLCKLEVKWFRFPIFSGVAKAQTTSENTRISCCTSISTSESGLLLGSVMCRSVLNSQLSHETIGNHSDAEAGSNWSAFNHSCCVQLQLVPDWTWTRPPFDPINLSFSCMPLLLRGLQKAMKYLCECVIIQTVRPFYRALAMSNLALTPLNQGFPFIRPRGQLCPNCKGPYSRSSKTTLLLLLQKQWLAVFLSPKDLPCSFCSLFPVMQPLKTKEMRVSPRMLSFSWN